MNFRVISHGKGGRTCRLHSPTAMPTAGAFLWNRRMMIQASCRGFATARFMQPEPASYSRGPALEAKTFMQPEQPYYAHHPGRFFYLKDEQSDELFSAPHEPVRAAPDDFSFCAGLVDISWRTEKHGLRATMRLSLPVEDPLELWECEVENLSDRIRSISLYPYFSVGYMSWMNQSAEYRADLGGILCSSVTPYQKVEDYFKNCELKDKTFFLHETIPDAWETCQENFEGEGGLHNPDGVRRQLLAGGDARYQVPVAALQYRLQLQPGEKRSLRFLFGPALDAVEVQALRKKYLSAQGFEQAAADYRDYLGEGYACAEMATPDLDLNHFANHWLPRQVFYHGDVNRLCTDPQTRNFLQDHMGMVYIRPHSARAALLLALSQQELNGAMPDGILLREDAELKYINQVPHTDHSVWLPVFLEAYLGETGDYSLLKEAVSGVDEAVSGQDGRSVFDCVCRAMNHLAAARDDRGLSYIAQGDWCDPMNMVGYRGKGVSAWLTLAAAHALKLWAEICLHQGKQELADRYASTAEACNRAVNRYLWDGSWFARGITDDGRAFGVSDDREGRIYLNPQSFAILSGAADQEQRERMIGSVEAQLHSPFGVEMLAPAYTAMRDDVGRLTQKHPGSAENGSVYNHAAIFYIYSLYSIGESERAWQLLRKMIPGPDPEDLLRRGQMPTYVPNYYRGAWRQYPESAGRSSQLFNTGTAAWLYRCILEQLFGLRGEAAGLRIHPQLPSHWTAAKVERQFRGATFTVSYLRVENVDKLRVELDGVLLDEPLISPVEIGRRYQVRVLGRLGGGPATGAASRDTP